MTTAFYNVSRWGSRWGEIDSFHPTPHKGLDILVAARGAVPILRSGKVVKVGTSSSVGGYYTVQVTPNDFDTYCHQIVKVSVGQMVRADQIGSLAAGPNDNHGSQWLGPHLHLARSSTLTGWSSWTKNNLNPEPIVRAQIATASTSQTQIGDTKMKPFILFGESTPDWPYIIDPYTQLRVYLDANMLSNLRESHDAPIERTVSDASLGSYQKRPGSRDHDGSIVPQPK